MQKRSQQRLFVGMFAREDKPPAVTMSLAAITLPCQQQHKD